MKEQIITAVDLGSHAIKACVAKVNIDGQIEVLSNADVRSTGITTGVISDIEKTAYEMRKCVIEAQNLAGLKQESKDVIVSISTRQTEGSHVNQEVAITDYVQRASIAKLHSLASQYDSNYLTENVHVLARKYKIDDSNDCVLNPLNMAAKNLRIYAYKITADKKRVANIITSVNEAGLKLVMLVDTALASSIAVRNESDNKENICVIDMGAATIEAITFDDEGLVTGSVCLDLGGNNVTRDMVSAELSYEEAEKLKTKLNLDATTNADDAELLQIMRCRYKETLQICKHYLGLQNLLSEKHRIIMTGGAAKVIGMKELAEEVFGLPASIECPKGVLNSIKSVNDPAKSTVIGMLKFYVDDNKKYANKYVENKYVGANQGAAGSNIKGLKSAFAKCFTWIKENI